MADAPFKTVILKTIPTKGQNTILVRLVQWNKGDAPMLDIRQFYTDANDGELKPTQKGTGIVLEEISSLRKVLNHEAIKDIEDDNINLDELEERMTNGVGEKKKKKKIMAR